jgi:hypothetical protein
MATAAAAIPRTTAPRRLYVGLAVLAIVIAAVGFWPAYFGPLVAGTAEKTPIVHLHAAVYVGWLALFLTQVTLAATGRVAAHMKIGRIAIGYGVLVIVVGLLTAFARFALRVRAGEVAEGGAQLLGPLLDMLVFAPAFAAAIYYRRKPELHKRLMVVATTSLLIAAVGRMQFLGATPGRFLWVYLIWTAPILLAMAHDFWRQRKVHPVYVLGLVVIVLEGPFGRRPAGQSDTWQSISGWLATWVV